MTNRTNERTNANANKKFAIFITSYNYAEYISQAIESVINQSDPDWRLYIFDNGSTDNTYEVVKKYLEKDSRISWKKREQNIGSIPNIIEGFKEIDADYISTLQADDWLEPNFVTDAKKAFAENPEIPFCAFAWYAVSYNDLQQTIFSKHAIPFPENFQGKNYLSPFLVYGNFIPIHLLVFKKDLLCKELQQAENLQLKQYLESFLIKNLEDQFGAGYLNKKIHGYWRRHDKQITKKNNENFQTFAELLTEPYFHCHQNTNSQLTKPQICNRFISILSVLLQIRMPYFQAVKWLLSDLGNPFLEKFCNFELNQQISQKSLYCLAVSSFIAHIYFVDYEGDFGDDKKQLKPDLFALIKQLKQQYPELKTIKDFFDEANQIYGGFFMPENAVKKLEKFVKKDSWLFN